MAGFHARENWYFERRQDGSVQMQKRLPIENKFSGAQDGWPVEHVVFDADTWASIVASVSAGGETGQTWAWAKTLHDGGHLIRASVTHGPDPMPGGPLPDPFEPPQSGRTP